MIHLNYSACPVRPKQSNGLGLRSFLLEQNMKPLVSFKPITGVYKIENTETRKIYIGQSDNVVLRIATHVNNMYKLDPMSSNREMILDFQKYGIGSFQYAVLEECEKSMLLERESFWAYSLSEAGMLLYNAKRENGNFNSIVKRSVAVEAGAIPQKEAK